MTRRTLLLGALLAASVPTPAAAHPYHASSALVHIRGRRVEVTLSVTPEDLQEALRRRAKRQLDIDTDAQVDALARAYVLERFVLRGPDGRIDGAWIGTEIEPDGAHLHFEFTLPKSSKGVTLHDTIFFDIAPAQVNRVQLRRGKVSRTLRFRATDPPRVLWQASHP